MDKLVYLIIMVSAFGCTVYKGLGRTFVYVYLPAVLFFWSIPEIDLPKIPNLTTSTALGYGIFAALLFRPGDLLRMKLNMLDIMMLLMVIPVAITSVQTEGPWEGISVIAQEIFKWLVPYFLGRIALMDSASRKHLVLFLCYTGIGLGFLAAMESRISPMFVSRALHKLHLNEVDNGQVFHRFGLMRALVTLGHHIDLGNVGVMLGALIVSLTPTVGMKWKERLPLFGVLGAGMMIAASISFTCFVALGAAFFWLMLFKLNWFGPRLVIPAAVMTIMGGVLMTALLLSTDTSHKPADDDPASSLWIRTVIVQDSWLVAQDSGLFGYGDKIPMADIGVGSVDNAYMLFIMKYGWAYLMSWVILILVMAFKGAQALSRCKTPSERIPVAALLAGIIAILFAMYTVWFGFVYAVLFCSLLGILSGMTELLKVRAAGYVAGYSGPTRGFAPMMQAGA